MEKVAWPLWTVLCSNEACGLWCQSLEFTELATLCLRSPFIKQRGWSGTQLLEHSNKKKILFKNCFFLFMEHVGSKGSYSGMDARVSSWPTVPTTVSSNCSFLTTGQ